MHQSKKPVQEQTPKNYGSVVVHNPSNWKKYNKEKMKITIQRLE